MTTESRKLAAKSYENVLYALHETPSQDWSPEIKKDLDALVTGLLRGLPQEAPLQQLQTTLDCQTDDQSMADAVSTAIAQLDKLDPLWLYHRYEGDWEVFKIDGDGLRDRVAITETEGLAIRLIDAFSPGSTIRSRIGSKVPESTRYEVGSDDDWDVYRQPEADEDDEEAPDEEWLASVSTETVAIATCHLIAG